MSKKIITVEFYGELRDIAGVPSRIITTEASNSLELIAEIFGTPCQELPNIRVLQNGFEVSKKQALQHHDIIRLVPLLD